MRNLFTTIITFGKLLFLIPIKRVFVLEFLYINVYILLNCCILEKSKVQHEFITNIKYNR